MSYWRRWKNTTTRHASVFVHTKRATETGFASNRTRKGVRPLLDAGTMARVWIWNCHRPPRAAAYTMAPLCMNWCIRLGMPRLRHSGVCSSNHFFSNLFCYYRFYHQQSATDRDQYIIIYRDNIKKGHEKNFDKYGADIVTSFGYGYDFDSVMHYSATAFGKLVNGKPLVTMASRPKVAIYSTSSIFANWELSLFFICSIRALFWDVATNLACPRKIWAKLKPCTRVYASDTTFLFVYCLLLLGDWFRMGSRLTRFDSRASVLFYGYMNTKFCFSQFCAITFAFGHSCLFFWVNIFLKFYSNLRHRMPRSKLRYMAYEIKWRIFQQKFKFFIEIAVLIRFWLMEYVLSSNAAFIILMERTFGNRSTKRETWQIICIW